MAKQGFIERQNKTTIYGILAVVVVVLIVALFLNVRPVSLFKTSTDVNLQGRASADAFYGTRTVGLSEHKVHTAMITVGDSGSRRYEAFIDDGLLIIYRGSSRYETELVAYDDGWYYASYPEDGATAYVSLHPDLERLMVQGILPHDPEFRVSTKLVAGRLYDGSLNVRGHDFYVQHRTGAHDLLFVEDEVTTVPLVEQDGQWVGTWSWDGNHVVVLDPATWTVTISELY